MNEEHEAVLITVYGRVQGVGFRAWTASQARRHFIGGWVKNKADSSVEILAEGSAYDISEFIESVRKGNSYSRVERLEQKTIPPSGLSDFTIAY